MIHKSKKAMKQIFKKNGDSENKFIDLLGIDLLLIWLDNLDI